MRFKSRKKWTDAELAMLAKLYPHQPIHAIATELDRPIPSVSKKGREIGLERAPTYTPQRSGRSGALGMFAQPLNFTECPSMKALNCGSLYKKPALSPEIIQAHCGVTAPLDRLKNWQAKYELFSRQQSLLHTAISSIRVCS